METMRSHANSAECIEHFLMLREATFVLFGKNQFAVDSYVELTGLTNGQFRLYVESICNLGRETHGAWFVVSNVAIDDFDLHATASLDS